MGRTVAVDSPLASYALCALVPALCRPVRDSMVGDNRYLRPSGASTATIHDTHLRALQPKGKIDSMMSHGLVPLSFFGE